MTEFDRSLLIDNIYRLVKDKKIKIGELEQSVGVSAGYLSRLAKNDSKGVLSADLLAQLSEKLGTTMDLLAFSNTKDLTENETYLLSFIDKLTSDTEQYNIEWKMLPPMIQDPKYLFSNPLFSQYPTGGEDEAGDYHTWYEMQYDSRFLKHGTALIGGDCFSTKLDKYSETEIYLMNVEQRGDSPFTCEKDIYEIYFFEPKKVEGVVCSKLACDQLKSAISRLYVTVEDARSHLTVDQSVKDIMSRFMKQGDK
jgi:transcriptional regulator with XRE-family HTH domain